MKTSVNFDDVAGILKTDEDSLRWFIELWFDPEDKVVLQRTSDTGDRGFLALPAKDLYENAGTVLNQFQMDGKRFEFHYGVNPVQFDIHSWSNTRKQSGLARVNGFYADFDVKPRAFPSEQAILDFIETLGIKPTSVVQSGSGGIHASWRVDGDLTQADLKGWWAYMQSKAPEGVQIDRLIDIFRILRLPGSVRWSKSGGAVSQVKLIGGSSVRTPLDQYRELIKEPLAAKIKAERKTRAEYTIKLDRKFNSTHTAPTTLEQASGFVKGICEARINELDWMEILQPAGWTFLKEANDGSRQWIRPGSKQKSATTDFTHPDGSVSDVMSLLSSSPDSDLLDLRDAGVPLTKLVVHLRLNFSNNLEQLIATYFKGDQ